MPRMSRMEKVDFVIPKGMHAFGPVIEAKYQEMYVLCAWERIVGRDIAKNVHPVAIRGTELLLSSKYGTWRTQITYMQDMILQSVNRMAGRELVKSVRFARERKDRGTAYDACRRTEERKLAEQGFRRKVKVLEQDKAAARERVACVEDKDLRLQLSGLLAKEKSEQRRKASAGKTCEDCGIYVEEGDHLCTACMRKRKERKREELTRYLMDIPWATLADIRKELDVTGDEVAGARARLVQQLARRVKDGDATSVDAKILVMLYRMVTPDQLTEELMEKSLRRLRYELANPFGKKRENK
ncbi:hypothetical protein TAMA11512_00050 [Selenomonas sp. TAMA-11512]|uniref:DUF721 domain-containing protein n=1 Tax=Selenomonas sp. TAMA-11512 TaxID=3095337 RepID=UPI0030921A01|nr:hypothetical protein TAMA11512_00050 [Selenomonas sp. TAMA-11512]